MKKLSLGREEFVMAGDVEEISARMASAAGEGVEERWMEVDGARMRYLRAGSGPPIVLLHGLLGYSFSWRYTMPSLARYATVYAPDLLGAGFSDRAQGLDHSLRATAVRLLQFVEHLGISFFDLLGTSYGGAVAMMAAAECQGVDARIHLQRLVLVDPVNPYSAHGRRLAPFLGSPIGSALFRLTIARMGFLYPYWHQRMYADRDAIPAGTFEGYMAPLAIPGLFEHGLSVVRTWTEDLRQLEAVLPTLASIPTLLIWGSEDSAVYASSAPVLAKHFTDARLIVYPGIGHLPYEECPNEFNRAVIEFLMRGQAPVRSERGT